MTAQPPTMYGGGSTWGPSPGAPADYDYGGRGGYRGGM